VNSKTQGKGPLARKNEGSGWIELFQRKRRKKGGEHPSSLNLGGRGSSDTPILLLGGGGGDEALIGEWKERRGEGGVLGFDQGRRRRTEPRRIYLTDERTKSETTCAFRNEKGRGETEW